MTRRNGQGAPTMASAQAPVQSALRGLPEDARERSAVAVLASVAWDGLPPDPDVLSAKEFLALIR